MLFSESCHKVTIINKADLDEINDFLRKFSYKDNTRLEHELFSFYYFFIAALSIDKITLPIEISRSIKQKPPDFRLSRIGEEPYYGLEHRGATVEKYKMDDAELKNKYPVGSIMEPDYYGLSNSPPKHSSIALVKPGEKLMGSGYGDNGLEENWAEIVLDAIEKKIKKLNEDGYKKHKENELLIEDDCPVNIFIIPGKGEKGIKMLREKYLKKSFPKNFDKIHIFIPVAGLFYDIFGETVVVKI